MTEWIYPLGGRVVWGNPNRGPGGLPIRESSCRACVHWTPDACALHYADFPGRKDCLAYAREPGSDDE